MAYLDFSFLQDPKVQAQLKAQGDSLLPGGAQPTVMPNMVGTNPGFGGSPMQTAVNMPPGAPGSDEASGLRDQWKQYLEQQIQAIQEQQQASKPTARPSGQPSSKKLGLAALATVVAHALGDKQGEFGKALMPALIESEGASQGARYSQQESDRMGQLMDAQLKEREAAIRANDVGRQLQELQQVKTTEAERKLREQAIIERAFGSGDTPADLIRGNLTALGIKITPEMEEQFKAIGVRQKAQADLAQENKMREAARKDIQGGLQVWGNSTDPNVRKAAAGQVLRGYRKFKDELPPEFEPYLSRIIEDAGESTPKQKLEEAKAAESGARTKKLDADTALAETKNEIAKIDKKYADQTHRAKIADIQASTKKKLAEIANIKAGGAGPKGAGGKPITDTAALNGWRTIQSNKIKAQAAVNEAEANQAFWQGQLDGLNSGAIKPTREGTEDDASALAREKKEAQTNVEYNKRIAEATRKSVADYEAQEKDFQGKVSASQAKQYPNTYEGAIQKVKDMLAAGQIDQKTANERFRAIKSAAGK